MKYLLYNKFDVRKFTYSNLLNQRSSLTSITKTGNITLKNFKALFEKELAANHQNQICLIKHKFNVNIKSFMQQLHFKEGAPFVSSRNDKLKYKAESF